jgi:hypothetical protein
MSLVPLTYPSRAALSSPPYPRAANPLQIRQARRGIRTLILLITNQATTPRHRAKLPAHAPDSPMRTWADLGAFGRGRVPVVYP